MLLYKQIFFTSFIIVHNIFFMSYNISIAFVLPAIFLDYVNVLHSKMGQIDIFSFYVGVTHYFIVKVLLTPIFLFFKTYDLLGTISTIKIFLGFEKTPVRALLADFNVYTYLIFKYIFFFKVYIELLNIQFAIFEKDKTDKDKELFCEFERDGSGYKYLYLKRELRFRLLLLQFLFSLVYLVIIFLLIFFFNLKTSNVDYFLRTVTEFDTNPQYLLRYGHYYR